MSRTLEITDRNHAIILCAALFLVVFVCFAIRQWRMRLKAGRVSERFLLFALITFPCVGLLPVAFIFGAMTEYRRQMMTEAIVVYDRQMDPPEGHGLYETGEHIYDGGSLIGQSTYIIVKVPIEGLEIEKQVTHDSRLFPLEKPGQRMLLRYEPAGFTSRSGADWSVNNTYMLLPEDGSYNHWGEILLYAFLGCAGIVLAARWTSAWTIG